MRSRTAVIALLTLVGAVCGRALHAQASPRAALDIYIAGLKAGNVELVVSVYYEEGRRRPRFQLPGPIPIDGYRIVKETVLDSAAAQAYTFVPRAMAGDVELDVEERIAGVRQMYTYWLRRIDGQWRIYAHAAWGDDSD